MSNTVRLAVTADGLMYIIQQIDFRTGRVHCWGELTAYKGCSTKHGPAVTFNKSDIQIWDNVAKNQSLVLELFRQAKKLALATQGPRKQVGIIASAEELAALRAVIAKL